MRDKSTIDMRRFSEILERSATDRNIDKSKTLTAWKARTKIAKAALDSFRRDRDRELEELRKNYIGDKYASMAALVNDEYARAARYTRDKVETDLADVLEAKRRAFDKGNSAPTQDMLNLLTALQMRGEDITYSEVAETVSKLAGNAPSLRALRSICKRAGITLPKFIDADPDEFSRRMTEAEKYISDGLKSFETDDKDCTYMERLFWYADNGGLDNNYFSALDSSTLTAAQIEGASMVNKKQAKSESTNVEHLKTGASPTGEKWVRVTVDKNGFSTYSVCEQFGISSKQLKSANPGRDLNNLHAGDTVNIPSTHMKSWPGIQNAIQEYQLEIIDAIAPEEPPENFGEVLDLEKEIV